MNVSKLDHTPVRRLLAVSAVSLVAATMLVASPASAQETGASASVGTGSLPGTTAATTTGGTDHSLVVGKLAVGWMGVNGLSLGDGTHASPTCNQQNNPPCRPSLTGTRQLSAPTIGVRYWLAEKFGIDVGLGLAVVSGSRTTYPYAGELMNGNFDIQRKENLDSLFGMVLHAGVPIVLGDPGRHYTFMAIPEANVGFASGSRKYQEPTRRNGDTNPPPPPLDDVKFGGFRLDVGARVGAEVQFGFIGLPQLALQSSVGLYFSLQSVSVSVGGKDASSSSTTIGTSVQQAPWAIFTNNIAALYYF